MKPLTLDTIAEFTYIEVKNLEEHQELVQLAELQGHKMLEASLARPYPIGVRFAIGSGYSGRDYLESDYVEYQDLVLDEPLFEL